jgi:hypothetical protein
MTDEQMKEVVFRITPEIFDLVRRMGEDLAPDADMSEVMDININVAVRFLATVISVSGNTNKVLEEVSRVAAKINEAQAGRVMN